MVCKITKVAGQEKTRFVVTLDVPKEVAIPEQIAQGKSGNLMDNLVRQIRGAFILQRTRHTSGSCTYLVSVLRSAEISDEAGLRKILSKLLETYELCLGDYFFEIDQVRPNTTSAVTAYCLAHRNRFTRRLIDAIKRWVEEEARVKQSTLRECFDDESLVGPQRLNSRESDELQNALVTRYRYVQVIELYEQRRFAEALALAKTYRFF